MCHVRHCNGKINQESQPGSILNLLSCISRMFSFFFFCLYRKFQYHGQKIPASSKRLLSTCRMWAEITPSAASTASSSTSPGESKHCGSHSANLQQHSLLFFLALVKTHSPNFTSPLPVERGLPVPERRVLPHERLQADRLFTIVRT